MSFKPSTDEMLGVLEKLAKAYIRANPVEYRDYEDTVQHIQALILEREGAWELTKDTTVIFRKEGQ
jgi:hypothetical protein